MRRAIVLMHRGTDFHILFYTVLCYALFGSNSVMHCKCLDCCFHTDCSGVSQLRTYSKIGAEVKNIKLENKHHTVFFFFFVKGKSANCSWLWQHRLGSGHKSTLWHESTACIAWFSRFLSCFLSKKHFFFAVKCLAPSFLGNTCERQEEIPTTVLCCFFTRK